MMIESETNGTYLQQEIYFPKSTQLVQFCDTLDLSDLYTKFVLRVQCYYSPATSGLPAPYVHNKQAFLSISYAIMQSNTSVRVFQRSKIPGRPFQRSIQNDLA